MTKAEKESEASSFLMRNGSIIYYLPRRENALNSYVKNAFIAGIELGENTLIDKAVKWLECKYNLPSDFENCFREAMK